jgi:hypothetical protein
MKTLRLFGIFCCVLALAACESESDKQAAERMKTEKAEETAAAKIEKIIPICPQVAIVRDLDAITDYGSEKPAPDKLIAGAKMLSVDGSCQYRDEGIDIKFDLNFVAMHGARLEGHHVDFPYFIAVVDPAGAVLNKDQMTIKFDFSSDSKTAQNAESLHVFIPLAKDKRQSGPGYQVLMGFQLTKEQFERTQK